MEQARMRIALEDILIQEHRAGVTARNQRRQMGNRWSTRADGGWRRLGMIALKSDGFRRLKDEIEGEGLKSEFRRLKDEGEGEGADRGPPGWKKGGREYSSDEDGDGPSLIISEGKGSSAMGKKAWVQVSRWLEEACALDQNRLRMTRERIEK